MDADATCIHYCAQDSLHARFIASWIHSSVSQNYAFPGESFTMNDIYLHRCTSRTLVNAMELTVLVMK